MLIRHFLSSKKRAAGYAAAFAAVLLLGVGGCAAGTDEMKPEDSSVEEEEQEKPEQLTVWYTDSGIEAYIQAAAEAYRKETGIIVIPVPMSAIDYLEAVNQANITDNQANADVYILNSEFLEEAYLAGLTTETDEKYEEISSYPQAALSACMYQGKSLGYPFYYETSFFLYNKNFIDTPPATFQEILDFSEQYGADGTTYEGIETILKWDVQNLYYNYGFAGAYLNLGGTYGDDSGIIDIANEPVTEALSFYKKLNQSLYFEASESAYDTVLQEFLDGKILYTIAGTQSLPLLEEAYTAGSSYGIAPLPDMNDALSTRVIAINYLAQVNPYSSSENAAKELAWFLTDTYIENFYTLTGKLSCKPMGSYTNQELVQVEASYAASVQLPKLMKASDYWMELELAFHAIWNAQIEHQAGEGSEEENLENQTKMEEEIRGIVAEEIGKVQRQMELQLQE